MQRFGPVPRLGRIGSTAAETALLDLIPLLPPYHEHNRWYGDHDALIACHAAPVHVRIVEALDLLAHMCVANNAIATMQARGWETSSGNKGYYPINGFTLIGMEWSAITDANLGVVVDNKVADYELAYQTLAEQGGAG